MDKRLFYLLSQVMAETQADAVYLGLQRPGSTLVDIIAQHINHPHDDNTYEEQAVHGWIRNALPDLNIRAEPIIIDQANQLPVGFKSALLIPLIMLSEITSGVFICSTQEDAFNAEHVDATAILGELILTVLENEHLIERLITTEAIATTAQAIARNPYPQSIIHILRDYLFETHISFCAIALYGPTGGDSHGKPFEYIEVKGDWSRQLGSQMITGTQIKLDELMQLHDALRQQEFLQIQGMDGEDAPIARLDAFSKLLMNATRLKSLVLIPLETRERRLGLLVIGSDTVREFNWYELRTYQIVSEFLTISTMTESLQREHDFVQQGRAALLEAVTDAVVMTLPNEHANILTANEHFQKLFNLSVFDTQGKSLWTVLENTQMPKQLRDDLIETWQALSPSDHRVMRGEFVMKDERSDERTMQWYSAPVFQRNSVLGRIYTFHDVSSERAEENLRYELLSRISHELRTPLTSIKGFAEFILEMTRDELPDLAREYIEIILSSARHLNSVYDDLIEFTRANVGEIELYFTENYVQDLVIETVARLEFSHKANNQRVLMNLDDDLPAIRFDHDRTAQILSNLLINAIKYAPHNSEIRITTSQILTPEALPISAPPATITPCMLISIIDEGAGISREDAEQIFLPFYRTKDAAARKIEGTGLGLAISRGIVELQRGKLWAEPATPQNRGGRFFFTIPFS
ncbi:MAG: ATP-binding protein [Aggregatilineales bacterium]